jgi:hypothetical protein
MMLGQFGQKMGIESSNQQAASQDDESRPVRSHPAPSSLSSATLF